MSRIERMREVYTKPLGPEELERRSGEGWRAVAVEWERETPEDPRRNNEKSLDVPFGYRVAPDCRHLEENPAEIEVLAAAMEEIVRDAPMTRVAEELNRRGFRTRRGTFWGPCEVFDLLPQLIDSGPRIFSRQDWAERRRHLMGLLP